MALLCAMPMLLMAQYTTQIVCGPNVTPAVNYVYLGSFGYPSDNAANCQKLQVDILGGTWGANSVGQTTFYIANRGGLTVNQIVAGSSGLNGSTLVAYANPDGVSTDFYLSINSATSYLSFAVRSYLMAGLYSTPTMVSITTQTTTPAGTPINLTINPVMITDASGNIGLNTANPDANYKLSVNGAIRAKEIKVEAGWADYVFDQDYPLMPLREIADYIYANHHLPGVPAAAIIKKNGVNVGETEAVLLKKVEELTLYLIEKDKQLQLQEERLKALEQQLNPNAKSTHQ